MASNVHTLFSASEAANQKPDTSKGENMSGKTRISLPDGNSFTLDASKTIEKAYTTVESVYDYTGFHFEINEGGHKEIITQKDKNKTLAELGLGGGSLWVRLDNEGERGNSDGNEGTDVLDSSPIINNKQDENALTTDAPSEQGHAVARVTDKTKDPVQEEDLKTLALKKKIKEKVIIGLCGNEQYKREFLREGIPDGDEAEAMITNIKKDNVPHREQNIQTLEMWRQYTEDALYDDLVKNLRKINLNTTADQVKDLIEDPENKMSLKDKIAW